LEGLIQTPDMRKFARNRQTDRWAVDNIEKGTDVQIEVGRNVQKLVDVVKEMLESVHQETR
jgi:hypothetical protein